MYVCAALLTVLTPAQHWLQAGTNAATTATELISGQHPEGTRLLNERMLLLAGAWHH